MAVCLRNWNDIRNTVNQKNGLISSELKNHLHDCGCLPNVTRFILMRAWMQSKYPAPPPPPPHSVLFRVRVCMFPSFENTPVRCVKSIRAGFLCTTTLVREKYPFTGHFGNTHAVPPTPEWGGGGAKYIRGIFKTKCPETSFLFVRKGTFCSNWRSAKLLNNANSIHRRVHNWAAFIGENRRSQIWTGETYSRPAKTLVKQLILKKI